jgi:hypothetical protein
VEASKRVEPGVVGDYEGAAIVLEAVKELSKREEVGSQMVRPCPRCTKSV